MYGAFLSLPTYKDPPTGKLIPQIMKVLSYKTSEYDKKPFTLQMARLYVCLDAGVSTSSSRRKSIRAVYLHPFISSNSAQWLLRI